MADVRLRFAPSPTGYLHVGGLRTALYSWLFARHNQGKILLRIEDTDQERKVEGATENLIETLEWAGIEFDEGPHKGGDFGPYIQSERLDIYQKHVDQLLEQGDAYYCFCTSERLDKMRAAQKVAGLPPGYDRHCRNLSAKEVEEKLAANTPKVVRMRIPDDKEYVIADRVRGNVRIQSSQLDDQVILKSDGFPTYHLANVVDDHLMKVSHVIRGEEWLSSTPKHLQLYEFFGWEAPEFGHLGLLLNMDGTKLSKRQGDVAVEDYREKNYLPEALVNFCALLGWSPGAGDNQEIFTVKELIEKFTLERVSKAGSKFNLHKLDHINEQHIHNLDMDRLASYLEPHVKDSPYADADPADLRKIYAILQSSLRNFPEIKERLGVFYNEDAPLEDPEKMEALLNEDSTQQVFAKFLELAEQEDELDGQKFPALIKKIQKETGVKGPKLWKPFRYALTREEHGPEIPLMVDYFGKDKTLKMVRRFLK